MSLLKLLSIMILCFIDFLDSSIPCISLIKKNFFSEIQGIIFYSMVILDKKYTSYLLLNQHFLVSFNWLTDLAVLLRQLLIINKVIIGIWLVDSSLLWGTCQRPRRQFACLASVHWLCFTFCSPYNLQTLVCANSPSHPDSQKKGVPFHF